MASNGPIERLPLELLLQVCKHFESIADLFACYRVSKKYRDILDTYGRDLLDSVGSTQFVGFESALILARVKRRLEADPGSVCKYDLTTKRYVNVPDKAWLEKLSRGKGVEDDASWRVEAKEVVDIYMLGLAFLTPADGFVTVHDNGLWLRAFYRYLIFTTLFGPGVFSGPITEGINQIPDYHIDNRCHDQFWKEYTRPYGPQFQVDAANHIQQYPIFSEPTQAYYRVDRVNDLVRIWKSGAEVFVGYLDWVCTQGGLEHPNRGYNALSEVDSISTRLERRIFYGFRKGPFSQDKVDEFAKQTTLYLPNCFFPFRVTRSEPTAKWKRGASTIIESFASDTPCVTARCLMSYQADGLFEYSSCTKGYGLYRNWENNGITFSAIAEQYLKSCYSRMWRRSNHGEPCPFDVSSSMKHEHFPDVLTREWEVKKIDPDDDSEGED